MSKIIVHLVTHDKFTAGYINFMKMYMKDYYHWFVVSVWSGSENESIEGALIDEQNVIKYSSRLWLAFSPKMRKLLFKADKIIVSGIVDPQHMIYFWPKSIFDKMYLQYWGGDFYQFRDALKKNDLRKRVYRNMLLSCFKRSQGAIFLIDGEYDKYKEIIGIIKKHVYVAAVPLDPLREFDFASYRNFSIDTSLRIVIGNSATIENNHFEVFEKLRHLKNESIEIYCPLSYGEDDYAEKVIKEGVAIFGEKFHPIKEWMKLHDYYRFLARCHIGIFNNDRQQAMGNILALLKMCRKVYLKSGTSMYKTYTNLGFVVHDVNELDSISIEELMKFDEKERNIKVANDWACMNNIEKQWKKVFDGE